MKIQVLDDDGKSVFSFDSIAAIQEAMPSVALKGDIANALHSASMFLSTDTHIIASIKSDIQSAVVRIETELGAHPAFTWAQTKLGHAAAHLEAYVKGLWTEPDPSIASKIVVDTRGVPVQIAVPPPQS